MGNSVLSGIVTMALSYVPDSVKNFLKGYGTYITAFSAVTLSGLELLGVDMTGFGITPDNAIQVFVTGLTGLFVRRAISNNHQELMSKMIPPPTDPTKKGK